MCKFLFNKYAKCGCRTFVDEFTKCPIASRPGQPAGMLCPIPSMFYAQVGPSVGGNFALQGVATLPHDCSRHCCVRRAMETLHEKKIYDSYVQVEGLLNLTDVLKEWKEKQSPMNPHYQVWLEHQQCRTMQTIDDHRAERQLFVQYHVDRARANPEEVPEPIRGFCDGEFEQFYGQMEAALQIRATRTQGVDHAFEASRPILFKRARGPSGEVTVQQLGVSQ